MSNNTVSSNNTDNRTVFSYYCSVIEAVAQVKADNAKAEGDKEQVKAMKKLAVDVVRMYEDMEAGRLSKDDFDFVVRTYNVVAGLPAYTQLCKNHKRIIFGHN